MGRSIWASPRVSGTIVRIDMLDKAIKDAIDDMNAEVRAYCNKAAEEAADETVKMLKETSPVRKYYSSNRYPPGSYARSWTKLRNGNIMGVMSYEIFNRDHYQLTHLLEFGHYNWLTGEETKAYPHIDPANRFASEKFLEAVMRMRL